MNTRTRSIIGLGIVLGLAVPAACGTDDTSADEAPTTSSPDSSASTQPAGHHSTTTDGPRPDEDSPDKDSPGQDGPDNDSQDEHGGATVTVEGVDYRFDDVPDSVPTGTRLSFSNASAKELHEMVVFRIPDTETRPLEQLVQRPPDELTATLGAPVTVMLQPPGAPEPIVAVGDGTVAEPGRYALMCFIPIGADPDEYLAAVEAAGGGKPTGVAGGPPHFTGGMFAELVVE